MRVHFYQICNFYVIYAEKCSSFLAPCCDGTEDPLSRSAARIETPASDAGERRLPATLASGAQTETVWRMVPVDDTVTG